MKRQPHPQAPWLSPSHASKEILVSRTSAIRPMRQCRWGSRPLRACAAALLFAVAVLGQQESKDPFPMLPPVQDGAVVHGRVIDATGNPVMGVAIFTSRIDAPTGSPLTIGRETTGIDGYFSLSGLAPATYRLCLDPQGKQYLDPCEWSEAPVTVQLERNGLIRGIDVPVEEADIVSIEVEDQADTLGKFAAAAAREAANAAQINAALGRIATQGRTANQGRTGAQQSASAPNATPEAGSRAAEAAAPTARKAEGALILGLRTRTGNLSMARLATADQQTKKLRYQIPAPRNEDLDVVLMPINLELRDKANTPLANRGSLTRLTKTQREEMPASSPVLELSVQKKVNP